MSFHIRKPTIFICKNKAADQLYSNCTADQGLCLRSKFSMMPLLFKLLTSLRGRTAWFVSDLVENTDCFVVVVVLICFVFSCDGLSFSCLTYCRSIKFTLLSLVCLFVGCLFVCLFV